MTFSTSIELSLTVEAEILDWPDKGDRDNPPHGGCAEIKVKLGETDITGALTEEQYDAIQREAMEQLTGDTCRR